MPITGTLRTWHDDRGFGFIAPTGGGRELFVHISAFPRDGSRPTIGESLTYEQGQGKDGKPQAVRVYRQALGPPSSYPRSRACPGPDRRSPVRKVIGVAIAATLGLYGITKYQQRSGPLQTETPKPLLASEEPSGRYRCDGRTYCSQMTSCAEAKYFLKNCPGTRMDGNNDGTPCERQWCTSPFAK
jgi:cold shock CspA family protein